MGKILSNEALGDDFYLMKVQEKNEVHPGQFYMLRAWDTYPVLSRPISIFDADGETVSFLYKKVGKGTELLTKLQNGQEITLDGPHGNGFPELEGKQKIALVGGGVGIAPLYLAAKNYAASCAGENAEANGDTADAAQAQRTVDIYLGFSGKPLLTGQYEKICSHLTVNVGGFVTDDIDPCAYDAIVTCGPTIMMKVLYEKCKKVGAAAPLYVSMENRMACGIGACLVCSCKTTGGNRKVCKDGPVFLGSEVFEVE